MIGERIKCLRKKKGVSQAELAKKIQVSAGNVGDWERGRAKPGADALTSLMDFFEVTADYLLTGDEKNNENVSVSGLNSSVYPLNDIEIEMILKFRQLDLRDQEDAKDNIDRKFERTIKRGTSYTLTTTDEEVATKEVV